MDDKIQSNLSDLFRQHFQELTPHPETMENIEPDHTKLNSKFYMNFVSIGRVAASEDKDTTQERNTISKELSFESVDSERKKTEDSYHRNPSKKQNVSNKKEVREGDTSDNDEDTSDKDILTTSSTN